MSMHESTYGRRRDEDGDDAPDRPEGADRYGRHLRQQTESSNRESGDDDPREGALSEVANDDVTDSVVVKTHRSNGAEVHAVFTTEGGSETTSSAPESSGATSKSASGEADVAVATAHNGMQSRVGKRPSIADADYPGCAPSEIAASRIRKNGGAADRWGDGSGHHPCVAQASGYLAPD